MKKHLLLYSAVATLAAFNAVGQTQRVSLYEEFTGENCNPCAATNPGLTTLIDNNQSPVQKIILLRYQVPIPSAPTYTASLYQQNSAEPNARQDFYYPTPTDQFAPQARLNGGEINGSTPGHAANITQSIINSNYVVNAPFALTTTHTFNAAFDSITINCTITAAQAFNTANPLNLRVAICEREIHYPSPPGSNGEQDFEWVMRKMVPDVNGTALAGTWTNTQSQTITLKAKIPTYIWDKAQISVVAFIQEDVPNPGPNTVRNVHQASYSVNYNAISSDASLNSVSTDVSGIQCATNFVPSFELVNTGSSNLTSCEIVYSINGGSATTYTWTGNLATGATDNVTLPTQTSSVSGYNVFTAYSQNPNGTPDVNTNLDTKTTNFNIFSSSANAPITEGFVGTTFPPAGFGLYDVDNDMVTWTRKTGNMGTATPTAAAKMDFYNSLNGRIDDMYLPYSNLPGTGNQLTFKVAYRQYSTENDRLEVLISTDCGMSWTSLYNKAGTTLKTLAASQTAFTPTLASQWRTETINLSAYDGMSNVIILMEATSDYGNNLYVDDINISNSAVGITEHKAVSGLNLYPNPAADKAVVEINAANAGSATITVINTLGQQVSAVAQRLNSGVNQYELNTSALANGVYTVVITAEGAKMTQKLTVSH